MKKGTKIAAVIIALAVVVAAGAAAFVYFGQSSREAQTETQTQTQPQTSGVSEQATQPEQETVSETERGTQSATEASSGTAAATEPNYRLPLTVREAMDALQQHYGSAYEINSTVEENGLNYFAVNYNGERYASVAVDLVTGRAEETIRETGAKTTFSLV